MTSEKESYPETNARASKDRPASTDHIDPTVVARRIIHEYFDRELTYEEIRDIFNAAESLESLNDVDIRILVIGSYRGEAKWKLYLVRDLIKDLSGEDGERSVSVFLLEEIPGETVWVNPEMKFRAVADIVDHIVGVYEHAKGGLLLEQGITSVEPRYKNKAIFLKKADVNDIGTKGFSNGVLQKLHHKNRLIQWNNTIDLIEACHEVQQRIIHESE